MREKTEVKIRAAYKRMETDAEFNDRLIAAGADKWRLGFAGERLDDWAWNNKKMQRRIVEDVA